METSPRPLMSSITNFNSLSRAKGLKIVHINIRSLLPKIEQLRIILQEAKIDIVTICETWLNNRIDTSLVDIKGYKSFRLDRKNPDNKAKRGGGLLVYINDDLALGAKALTNLNTMNGDLESQWIEIDRPNARNIQICNSYRPPTGHVKRALTDLSKILSTHTSRKKDLIILGDFNINYKNKTSPAYKTLAFFEKANNLSQYIKTETRLTKNSSTLLDLILTNAQYISQAGTLDTFISDHQPVFLIKKKPRSHSQPLEFRGRSYTNYNCNKLRERLLEANWRDFFHTDSVNFKWEFMLDEFEKEIDNQCPFSKFRLKKSKPNYITDDLLNQIKNRDYYYKKAKKTLSDDDWNVAKYLRNQTNKNIRTAKAQYTISQLDACQNDSAKFWRIIKEVVPSKNKSSKGQISLKGGQNNIDPEVTAEYINTFFVNVGNIDSPPHCPPPKIHPKAGPSAPPELDWDDGTLEQVSQATVFRITNSLSTSKSSGLENISPKVIKDCLLSVNEQFTHLINSSLKSQQFPSAWKKAKVVPIPKPGDLTNVSNFRPISLLPAPGKVLEKVVHTKLENYLEEEELLTDYQFGFRKGRSTLHAVTQLLDHVNLNLNRRIPTVALFIDFRKAFDCLQYPTLLEKLNNLSLGQTTINWIGNYLTDRSQTTFANGCLSPPLNTKQGVPQGSILGPLLYILYANDIPDSITESEYAFYADDTVLYTSSKNVDAAIARIQRDLNRLLEWCARNSIHINPQKTKYMIFSSRELGSAHSPLKLNDVYLEQVRTYHYLGIVLDQHLTFNSHAKHVIGRVSSKIYQLRRLKKFLSNKAALLVYKNMILPIMEYGDIYVMSASKENRSKLKKLQNKALKCALDKEKRYSTNRLHCEAKIYKLRHRRKLHLLQHMHRISQMPNYTGWKLRPAIQTRSSKKKLMKVKKPNLTKFQNSITYVGPKAWNSLPKDIQKETNYPLFNGKIRLHLLKIWKYEYEEPEGAIPPIPPPLKKQSQIA